MNKMKLMLGAGVVILGAVMGLVAFGMATEQTDEPNVTKPQGTTMVQDANGQWHIEEPEVGNETVIVNIAIAGFGGDHVLLCDAGGQPWQGQCQSVATGVNAQCASWSKQFSATYDNQLCDGQTHYFPAKDIWVLYGNGYHKIGTVNPSFRMPSVCFRHTYTTTERVSARIPPCTDNGHCNPPISWFCQGEDTHHLGYLPNPTCCNADWTSLCATCWDPIGQLQFSCCCHYDPVWGWMCI